MTRGGIVRWSRCCGNKHRCQLNCRLLLMSIVVMLATQRLVNTPHANVTWRFCQPLPPAGRTMKPVIIYIYVLV